MNISSKIYNTAILASPSKRFAAVLIDLLLSVFVEFAVLKILYPTSNLVDIILKKPILVFIIYMAIMCIINFKYLFYGQTIGKKLMKIQVRTKNGNIASFGRMFIIRILLWNVIFYAAYFLFKHYHYKNLSDILVTLSSFLVFTPSRRCLHDYVAGTIVTNFSTLPKIDVIFERK